METQGVVIKFNNTGVPAPCVRCGKELTPPVGLALFLEGTWDIVCEDCTDKDEGPVMARLFWYLRARPADVEAALAGRDMFQGHFGLCPHCHGADGWLNAGSTNVFYCDRDRVSWIAGAGFFDDGLTEFEQRREYKHIDDYERIENEYCPLREATERDGRILVGQEG